MKIYVLLLLVIGITSGRSEDIKDELEPLERALEDRQKALDQKVERYNELLRKHHKLKQKNADEKGGQDNKDEKPTAESADARELSKLSADIEEEQEVLDKKVEYYNNKLQNKHTQEVVEQEREEMVEPLKGEIRRLTDMVERLQKDMKDVKNTAIIGEDEKKSPMKTFIQGQFEQILVRLKEDVRAGIESFEKFVKAYPNDELAVAATLQLGGAYNKIGRWDTAYTTFKKTLEFEKVINPQVIEAKLGMAEAQIGKNNRESACMTLIQLEKSNNPMSMAQLDRYQKMLVDYHCSSKMDRDVRKNKK